MRTDQQQPGRLGPVGQPRRRYLQVAEQLLEAIERGDYPPGSRLPGDREIAGSTKVSRPTVREALLALEIVGAIEVQPGIGAKVIGTGPTWDPDQELAALGAPRDLMETRALVEPLVAELCARRIGSESLVRLRSVVDQSIEADRKGAPLSRLSELGISFHLELARACGNAVLSEMVCHLIDIEEHPLWALVNQIALRGQGTRRTQNDEHLAILAAIAAKNADAARTSMANHLERTNALLFGDPHPTVRDSHRPPARRRLGSTDPTPEQGA
ncbi:MAG TPA: FCD domain-containing protein [Nakamurella sp.]|nr:FCD domain-containing protein [Nakamurella sp.]